MDTSKEDLSDEELAESVQKGDLDAFGLLVSRYENKILRYGRRFLFRYEEIEDLVQEVFIKVYVNIRSFDSSRKFSSWIYRIAHNEFVNAIKKKDKKFLSFFDLDTFLPHPKAKEETDKDVVEKDIKSILDKSLDKLKPKYREILILHYLEALSYKEIADVLRIPPSTVGVRIKRGKDAIKKILTSEYGKQK